MQDHIDASILRTKLFAPSIPGRLIQRPHLQDRLTTALSAGTALLLVYAPAGYGKSTLLAEWVAAHRGASVWISLDERDNNPRRFWTYIAEALKTVADPLGRAVLSALGPEGPGDPRVFLTALLNDAATLEHPVILILDDYHVISESEIHAAVAFLLDHAPPSLRIAIATRTDPPFTLGRLRVNGRLTEVRVADLRFSTREVSLFLNDLMGIGLNDADIHALESRTEGWVAGLQLAALSMQDRQDSHAFVKQFTGSQHFVLEYLVDEVLKRQPERLQRFLLETSILPRLCAPVCDALTDSHDSATVLSDLYRRNLFIIPLDSDHYWVRYHHLFAEFLRGHLRRLHAGDLPDLYRRGAEWFRTNNCPEDALQLALELPDYRLAGAIVTDNWRRVYHTGRLDTAVKWITLLPGDLLRRSPALGVAFCWTLFIRGHHNRIGSYLDSIESSFDRTVAAGELPAEHPEYNIIVHQVTLLRAVVKRHDGRAGEALQDIQGLLPAVAELGDSLGEIYAHMGFTACYSQLGYTYAALGEYDRAEEYLSRVSLHARACGNFFSLAHATMEWATIKLSRGKPAEAQELCRRELALRDEPEYSDVPAFSLIQLALADALCADRSWEEAEALLDEGLKTVEATGHDYYLARGNLIAARLHHARGRIAATEDSLRTAERIATRIENHFLDTELARVLSLLHGDTDRPQSLAEPLSDRELEVLRLICTGRSNQEIADELFVALDTVKRHTSNIYGKLGVARRTQAVLEAHRVGLV